MKISLMKSLGLAGILAAVVLSGIEAAPTKSVRYASEGEIKDYVKKINNGQGCALLNEIAATYKIEACTGCTNATLTACFNEFYHKDKDLYGGPEKRKLYGFDEHDEIDMVLKEACNAHCTADACQDPKIKKACDVFCNIPGNAEGIQACP